MVDTAMGRCMEHMECKEYEVRSWLDYLVEHTGGDRRLAYNMIRACADIVLHQGLEDAAFNVLYPMAEALRAGDKNEVDHTDGWAKENGDVIL